MSWTERYIDAASSGGDGTTAATSGTNAAWANEGSAITAIGAGPASSPTRINWKAGSYSNGTTSRTFNTAGATTAQVWWRGYKNTPGDMDGNALAVGGVDIPAISFTTGVMTVSGANQIWSNLDVTGAPVASSMFQISAAFQRFYNMRFRHTGTSVRGVGAVANSLVFCGCYFESTSAMPCVSAVTSGFQLYAGCYFKGGAQGFTSTTAAVMAFLYNIFDSPAGDAIRFSTGYANIFNCSFYAPGGNAILWSGTPASNCQVANNYFEAVNQASTYPVNNSSGTNTNLISPISNAFYNCTGTYNGLGDTPPIFDVGTLAASGFANAAGGDFTPAAALIAAGYPGRFETMSAFRGFMTPGALQAAAGGPFGGFISMP